ncbi:hypothetical protein L4C31_14500 [Aliivibrio sifiae]
MKKILLILTLIPSFVFANPTKGIDDVVQLVGPYKITEEQAQDSLIHLYIPENSIGVIGIQGGDKFADTRENSGKFSVKITDNESTIFINNDLDVGKVTSFGISTYCGTSISVSVHSITTNSKVGQIQPKLSILSTGCEVVGIKR